MNMHDFRILHLYSNRNSYVNVYVQKLLDLKDWTTNIYTI